MAESANPESLTERVSLRELVEVGVDELRLHPDNPRRGRVDLIAQGLVRYGQYRPVVARRTDRTVLVGNHMLLAARELGWQSVRVLYVDLSDAEANRLLVWDNRSSDLAENDTEALVSLLESLKSLAGSGFEPADLDELLDELEPPPLVEDELPPVPEQPVTTPGELLVLGEHRLVCGDARDPEAYERLLEREEAAMLWTDPPYGVSYEGKTREKLRIANDKSRELAALLAESFSQLDRVLAPGAPLYITHPAGPLQALFIAAFLEVGWVLRQSLVWVKDSIVLGHSDHHYRHEPLLYGFKQAAEGRLGRGGAGWFGNDSQSSVFEVDRPRASREHPTMKPPELIEIALKNSSMRGGIVLDPFAGSGSTLIACERVGRCARLIELDAAYCDVIIERYERLTGHSAVREAL